MASDREVLPRAVIPRHYKLSIHTLSLGAPWTYQGRVLIDAKIKESTDRIVLNTNQLKIHDAHVTPGKGQSVKAKDISYNEKAQQATFTFDSALPPSAEATLDIKFEGVMNTLMAGFYRARYKPPVPTLPSVPSDGEYRYMFSTQFEACDARRAFPCFDEPNLKASFDLDLEIPDDQTALSNMPEKETSKGSKPGLKVVHFDTTPVMSTYLLAWAIGDLAYVEQHTKRKYNGKSIPVRVYAPRGLEEQGRYALDCAHQTIDLFSEIFQIEYPLPKSDLLAVPEFAQNAMENWGLVTYRTTAVLFDEKNSDPAYKPRIAYVVAHELAHQWFGNLVTMDWWNELWLNEGFATWVGWYAVDHFHPEWNSWSQFVMEDMQAAYNMDSLRSSHPIEVPVRDAIEADQVFDAISYRKGCSVLRMLAAHLTPEVFLQGVGSYLKAHAYGNATTEDLWAHIGKASGQDVAGYMNNWIQKMGFPLVTIAEEPGQITIRQSRFLSTGDVKPDEDHTTWWIPLGMVTGSQTQSPEKKTLATKEEVIRAIDDSFYKINKDHAGFYRTNYPPSRLAMLGASRDRLSAADKVGLVSDASALARSGDGTTPSLLSVLEGLHGETHYNVWAQIINSLATIRYIFAGNDRVSDGLKKFTLKLTTPAFERLGWDEKPGEDALTRRLRTLLISAAGMAGHQGIIAEANKRFSAYMGSDPARPNTSVFGPNFRSPVFRLAVRYSDPPRAAYDAVKAFYEHTTSVDGKEIALQALGRTPDPALARDLFAYTMGPAVALQDAHTPLFAMSANAAVRDTLWACFSGDWSRVQAKTAGSTIVADRFIRVSLQRYASRERAAEIRDFFADKDTAMFAKALAVTNDTIVANAAYRERDEARLQEFLVTHGYA